MQAVRHANQSMVGPPTAIGVIPLHLFCLFFEMAPRWGSLVTSEIERQ
jgi:hypothetical protein